MSGTMENNDVPMYLGARCGDFYHNGLLDEVIIACFITTNLIITITFQFVLAIKKT